MDKFVVKQSASKPKAPEKIETAVRQALEKSKVVQNIPRKNKHFTGEELFKVGKYVAENGNIWAVRKFDIGESAVRTFRKGYFKAIRKRPADDSVIVKALPSKKIGRPPLLGDLDSKVQDYLKELQSEDGIVNRNIVIATSTAYLEHYRPDRQGDIELGKKMGRDYVVSHKFCQGTKQARNCHTTLMRYRRTS